MTWAIWIGSNITDQLGVVDDLAAGAGRSHQDFVEEDPHRSKASRLSLKTQAPHRCAHGEFHSHASSVLKTMKTLNEGAGIVVDDGALLECVLPMEGGRTSDVLVLENGVVVVLEFKVGTDGTSRTLTRRSATNGIWASTIPSVKMDNTLFMPFSS